MSRLAGATRRYTAPSERRLDTCHAQYDCTRPGSSAGRPVRSYLDQHSKNLQDTKCYYSPLHNNRGGTGRNRNYNYLDCCSCSGSHAHPAATCHRAPRMGRCGPSFASVPRHNRPHRTCRSRPRLAYSSSTGLDAAPK